MRGAAVENALLVSNSERDAALFTGFLNAASVHNVTSAQSCGGARRLIQKQDFDLIIVDTPDNDSPGDDSCESFSRYAAAGGVSQVILLVKGESFNAVSSGCEEDGVLTISKPMNRELFWSAVSLAKSVQNRIKDLKAENAKLKQKIEDIRVVDRAKWILVSTMKMNEQEAHRYIEKQAMDMRSSRRSIAEGILKRYEN